MTTPGLVIAGHGTRDDEGAAACRQLVDKVAALLPDVPVRAGFVELVEPSIDVALAGLLAQGTPSAVVVPLMIGTGGHVRVDIPEAIAQGRADAVDADVRYARHLGPDPLLRQVVRDRIATAAGDWDPSDTTVVLVGRGALVADANADHVRLARVLWEEAGYREVVPCFIQVTRPDLAGGLDRAYATGARRIVVMPHFLFPGQLRTWTHRQTRTWCEAHPDAEVRLADVIGPCDELARVVAARYRASAVATGDPGSPVYLAGLDLRGRLVVVVGGGTVAARRLPGLLAAGATVRLIAPDLVPAVQILADAGRIRWIPRAYDVPDLAGAWFAMALTDDPAVNAEVARVAAEGQVFCVRGDDAPSGTAWTPATGRTGGLTIAAIGHRTPHLSARARDVALDAVTRMLAEG